MPRLIGLVAVALSLCTPAAADPICAHTKNDAHACRMDNGELLVKVGRGPWVRHRPVVMDEAAPVALAPLADVVPPEVAADALMTIDVLAVGSTASVRALGGFDAFAAVQALNVANFNTAAANSLVPNVQLRLVGVREAAYVESTEVNDLNWIVPHAAAWRDAVGADVVQFVTESSDACGYGMLGPDVGLAYSVVNRGCQIGNLSGPHELGHNFGMAHDPAGGGMGWFAYSHGYVDPSCAFRTIMSYGGCWRVTQFSSPLVYFNGKVTGTTLQDNRLTLINNAAKVAAFRVSAFTTQALFDGWLSGTPDDRVPTHSLLALAGLCLACARLWDK